MKVYDREKVVFIWQGPSYEDIFESLGIWKQLIYIHGHLYFKL